MKLNKAEELALSLIDRLKPHCKRIEIAGSIRRRKPEVKDIELVAIPKPWQKLDMFGNVISQMSSLEQIDWLEIGCVNKNGRRYKQILLPEGINLDLFIVLPPAQWGVIFATRTGPPEYSKWLVTSKRKGGAMPSYLRCKDGVLVSREDGHARHTPEEEDFFEILGLKWIPPEQRQPPGGF